MASLFGRSWLVTIGDVDVSDLAVEFSAKKTLKPEPNTCDLKIYNLSKATRERLTSPRAVTVRIEAGYGSTLSQIYLGEVRALAPGTISGPEIVTELSSGDGEKAMKTARLAVPIGAGMSTADALRAVASTLGVGLGNIGDAIAALNARGVAIFKRGTVITGATARALTDLCRSAGLEWSVQDGALQFLDLGAPLAVRPYVISADSGMIGAPKLDADGKVSVETLMLPGLRPGMQVQIESLSVRGLFRICQAEYKGATWGDEWGISLTCDRPGATA